MYSQYLIYFIPQNIYNLRHIIFIIWVSLSSVGIIISSLFLKEELYLFFYFNMFELSFVVDFLSIVFFNTLMIIVISVLYFSKEYINGEKLIFRFLLFTLLFISSIVFFIFGRSIFSLLIGWDGLGVTSFFLVLFFQNSSSWRARIKTALTNRLGDGFLIIVFASLLLSSNIFTQKIFFLPIVFTVLLILGSFTKSAQFPFRNWLPAAIAAPTPISSLVHSSTLVTAGVFLVIRFNSFFTNHPHIKILILVRRIITILFAGSIALFEKDLKKVVALSTLSHLGLIILSCSIVGPLFGFFHLIIHAIFKALLFINIGYLIINRGHNQDRRLLRLNSNYLTISVLFRLFRIIGFYFFNGFFSKDLIIFTRLSSNYNNLFLSLVIFLGFGLTVAYSIRFFIRLFSFFKNVQISLKKSIFKRTLVLLIMCLTAGEGFKKLILENFIFFYAEKMSFFIPFSVILIGFFIFKTSTFVKTFYSIERIFFLNFILGNWLVNINNSMTQFFNKEVNNVVNVLLEKNTRNKNIQLFSNSLLKLLSFLTIIFIWLLVLMFIFSSYSL